MGVIVSVNISKTKGVCKYPVDEAYVMINHGLEGDAHAGQWHRQVSLLAQESIDKIRSIGFNVEAGKFAENITTEGIILYEMKIGTKLKVGGAVLEITQIGKECHHGCEIRRLVGDCVMPREGVFTRVVKEGIIKPGDSIFVL